VSRDRVRMFLAEMARLTPALAAVAGRMDGTDDVLRAIGHRLRQPLEVAPA